jgi:hypothetical protein
MGILLFVLQTLFEKFMKTNLEAKFADIDREESRNPVADLLVTERVEPNKDQKKNPNEPVL